MIATSTLAACGFLYAFIAVSPYPQEYRDNANTRMVRVIELSAKQNTLEAVQKGVNILADRAETNPEDVGKLMDVVGPTCKTLTEETSY